VLRRSFVAALTGLIAAQTATAQTVATPSLTPTATSVLRQPRATLFADLTRYSNQSLEILVQDPPPVAQRQRRSLAKIVMGVAMIGASVYLFSQSRGWKHIEYEYGPNYPANPLNFEIEQRCRTSRATPPFDAVQASVANERCALLWQPTAATVLLAGGVVVIVSR
jgi:hypothetical protein